MSTHFRLALLIYGIVTAVLFGTGTITILSIPSLQEQWKFLIPVWVVASWVVAAPVAWFIAPRLRARYWRDR